MKNFSINEGSKSYELNLPTSINEITSEYLNDVTADIQIAPYHAIVAAIYRCRLMEVVSLKKKSRAMAIAIVPTFVRANISKNVEAETLAMFDDIKSGDKIIIAGTDIERGYQLSVPKNYITLETVIRAYNNDSSFAKNAITDQEYYYFADFKLVPINDIKGFYKPSNKLFVNPFISFNTESSN